MDVKYAIYVLRKSSLELVQESFGEGTNLPVERCLEILASCQFEEPRKLIERRIGTSLDDIDDDDVLGRTRNCRSGQVMIETQLILQEAMMAHRQQVRAEEVEKDLLEQKSRNQEEIARLKDEIAELESDESKD